MTIRANLAARQSGTTKLNEGQVREIRRRLASGETAVSIAPEYRVSPTQIRTIRRREAWADVADTKEDGA